MELAGKHWQTRDRGDKGKRPYPLYEGDIADCSGKQKRRNQGSYSSRDLPGGIFVPRELSLPLVTGTLTGDVVFRILCPAPKIGSVIGKGGSIIKTLRQESGAKIKIADAIPGTDERVIIISTLDRGSDRGQGKDGRSRDSRDRGQDDGLSRERDGCTEADWKDRDSSYREGGKLSPAQEALFKVLSRIVADAETLGGDGYDREEEPSLPFVTRLLVPNSQIGCLLGKGGKIIEQMRQSSGAQIRVLPKDQLPGCALPSDEIVQVSGDMSILKAALLSISSRLQENPPRDRPPSFASLGLAFVPITDYLPKDSYRSKGNGLLPGLAPEPHLERDMWSMRGGNPPLDRLDTSRCKADREFGENELLFRLLCPSDKIGSVIGKGGSIIYNLRKETGARIKIANAVPGSDERVIIASAFELPGDAFSPTLEAMIQVQGRITAEMGGDKDGIVSTRLLVPANQIGCLLGKGGSIIEDMRRATRANIRVLPKDTLPRCAMEEDELVQIVGDTTVAREALFQVISRLRNNAFRGSGSETGSGGVGPRDCGHSMSPACVPRNNYSSGFDFGGRVGSRSPHGAVFPISGMHSSSGYERISSPPEAWGIGGGGGLSSLSGFGGGPSHLIQPLAGDFGGGWNRVSGSLGHGIGLDAMSIIEIHIPNIAVGSVIGKGGINITRIRQISGANVKLQYSKQATNDRVLELSGTLEQTHAAQILVQAYMQSSMGAKSLPLQELLPDPANQVV